MRIKRQMTLWHELFYRCPSFQLLPPLRNPALQHLCVLIQLKLGERLEESDKHEGHLVVCELLAKADARPGIEGNENVRVRDEILLDALIEEAVWVKLIGWDDKIRDVRTQS